MDTLENTYYWLGLGEQPFPNQTLTACLRQLHQAAETKQINQALTWMQIVHQNGAALTDAPLKARLHLECARANFNLGLLDDALREIDAAIALLEERAGFDSEYKLINGIAHWMLGNLLLTLPDQRSAVLAAWQKSLNDFTNLAACPPEYHRNPSWFRDRCAEMRQGIERLIASGSPRPRPSGAAHPAARGHPRPSRYQAPSGFPWPISTLYAGNIKSLPVIGEIPAGGFAATGIGTYTLETLQVEPTQDEFIIANQPYRLVNLRGSPGVTELVSSRSYMILQVKGDSMNADQIEPGDYVLLVQQNSADQMDIVAAEIVNVDAQATLKRFRRKNGMITLEPRSTNPRHQPFTFPEGTSNFFIRGVALGVFKPA